MAPPVENKGSLTVLIPEGARYLPLGTKIQKLDYQLPDGWQKEEVLRFLAMVKEDLKENDLSIVPYFYEILGVSTANLEDFKKISSLMWSEFKETAMLIANRLLVEKDGRRKAAEFLRPLAYREIPENPDHIWGYPIPSVSLRIPNHRPPRCSWRYINEEASHILDELRDELGESFERRDNPGSLPAQDQCSEPHQPMRYRLEAGIEGPSEVEEGGLVTLTPLETSQVEYGKNYEAGESLPTERAWNIDEYTCSEPPTVIDTNENQFKFQVPKVLHQDCKAVISLTTKGPYGAPVRASHTVEILNKEDKTSTIEKLPKPNKRKVKLPCSDYKGRPMTAIDDFVKKGICKMDVYIHDWWYSHRVAAMFIEEGEKRHPGIDVQLRVLEVPRFKGQSGDVIEDRGVIIYGGTADPWTNYPVK